MKNVENVILVLCCLYSTTLFAQGTEDEFINNKRSGAVITISPKVAQGKELVNAFGVGLGGSLGANLNVYQNKVMVKPYIEGTYFGSNLNEAARSNLILFDLGLQIQYGFHVKEDLYYYPILDVKYGLLTNYISPRGEYKGDNVDLVSGSGVSTGIGIGLSEGNISFSILYNYYKPKIEADSAFEEELNDVNELYDPYMFKKTTMDFSHLQFTIGYNFPQS